MNYKKIIVSVATLGAVCLAAMLFAEGEKQPDMAGKLLPAPAWQLQGLDGRVMHLTDFKGKVVILDFWATWCPPCRMEIPGFVELQKQYEKQGLTVIGASVDQIAPADVKKFAEGLGVNYPIVMADAATSQAYGGIEAIPTTFVIDRAGRIVKQHTGYTDKGEFENEIKPLLKP